ncbi:hypothetical protein M9Y10_011013 [Tritrichomonas musculus]|uniref:DUF3447 domain-containing protein n=1 Tax=Tritrichomonas musculus TaxID=1915356 RepID=A0ABR2IMC4_9EUKA
MSSQEYLDMMKNIQESILNFLGEEAKSEENFLILEEIFNNSIISDNKYYLMSLLHLISKIGNNFHRFPNFFIKIERILLIFKEDIKKYFSNSEIFNFFKSNKRILLFLIEQQIMVMNEYIVKIITKTDKFIEANYPLYFRPEIQPFINEKWFPKYYPEEWALRKNIWIEELKKELPENFYEKRKEGQNDNQISELICKDMIEEFVTYVTRNGVSLNGKIQPSIYETNSFLLKKQKKTNQNRAKQEDEGFSLIEYAVFFGSIQIFKYLIHEGVELSPSLWPLAIHGKNSEIIHFLEDNHVELEDESYKQVFHESIKCHHNDIANYILNNFLQNDEEDSQDTISQSLKYYNFAFLKNKHISESSFCNLCKYDYCALSDILLKDIDVNAKEIINILLIQFHIINIKLCLNHIFE